MKKMMLLFMAGALSLTAAESAKPTANAISEAFGHMLGKNMEAIGVEFNIDAVIKGLQDSICGVESPLSESECIEAITSAQEEVHKKKAAENLAKAEEFLQKNAQKRGVEVVENGKLQYKVRKKGKGLQVEEGATPLIKYEGKFLDGSVFGASEKEDAICLKETIQGFQKGIVGMKEGEKRTLFIHPEYGYGTQGRLPPNSLLVFEIEVVKAGTSE